MKKHFYKLIAGTMIVTTLFSVTGCSNKKEVPKKEEVSDTTKEVPKGRYVEKILSLPQDIKHIQHYEFNKNGEIVLYASTEQNKYMMYTSKDGKEWSMQEEKWLDDLIQKTPSILQIDYDKEENPYVLYYDDEYNIHIGKVINNVLEDRPYDIGEQSANIQSMQVLTNGDIALGIYMHGVVIINGTTGKVTKEYLSTGMDREFVITQDEVLLIDNQRGGVVVFDLETGKEKQFIACEGNLWESKLDVSEEGNIYLMGKEGISRLTQSRNIWEQVVEGQMSSFGMPSLYIADGKVKGEDEFIVLFQDTETGPQLIHYGFDPNMPTKPTTEVSLYMLEEDVTIKQAVAEYQRQNPDVLVNIQVGINQGDTITKADAIRTLNTQLLAGKGPDLMLLDGLPVQSYMDKGVLLDMSDWAEEELKSGNWLENIVGAYQEDDGAIYTLPLKFTLPTVWGNKEIIQNANDMTRIEEWVNENPDKKIVYSMSPEKLIQMLYGPTAHLWLDDNGQILEETFIDFIECIQVLADVEAKNDEDPMIESILSTEYMGNNETQIHFEQTEAFDQLDYHYSAITQRGDGAFDLIFKSQGGVFMPKGIVGINANSKYQDIATDIVKLAMSKSVQQVALGSGLPVHKEVFNEQANLGEGKNYATMPITLEKPIAFVEATQEEYTNLANLAKEATIPALNDEVLMNLIIEETKGYFHGEKTAEEAAASTAKRTRAYLAE